MFNTIKGNKFRSLRLCANNNLMALNHVGIKAMHWLSVGHHNVVCDVNNIVNWTQANRIQFILKPFRAFLYLTVSYADTSITFASFVILNYNVNR